VDERGDEFFQPIESKKVGKSVTRGVILFDFFLTINLVCYFLFFFISESYLLLYSH
jgi:hypothetical protein